MRTQEERFFTAAGGVRLPYLYWPPSGDANDGARAVLLVHAGPEDAGRLPHFVDELWLDDFAMFAWDARGHDDAPDADAAPNADADAVRQLDAFARHVSRSHGISFENMAVVGWGFGGLLAAAWVHDYAPHIRCMVLSSPPLGADPRASELRHAAERISADAAVIQTPVQLLLSEADIPAGQGQPQQQFFSRLGSQVKERHVFPGRGQDPFAGPAAAAAVGKARAFLSQAFTRPPCRASLLDADRRGHTKEEFDALCRPLPLLSTRRLSFALMKLTMNTVGRLSDGIRLGLRTGFDSGSTLDYVYRGRASGITPLGRALDEGYLDSIGWRGVRMRRRHLHDLMLRAARQLRAEGAPVRVLDIAAGVGRYVLEAMSQLEPKPDGILLRDYSDLDVRQGRELIKELGLEDIASFEAGDAFDRDSLAAIRPSPTLAVVCGLYELFPDNAMVRASLDGLSAAMGPGGYLLYTGMIWHPEMEFLARVLPSHRPRHRCLTRRRCQAEMDELVEQAGFAKVEQLVDQWGIFTVSAARRTG